MADDEIYAVCYAVCPECAHAEPRPDHTENDWMPCEQCGDAGPDIYHSLEDAEQASQDILDGACKGHPAGSFSPMGVTVYCDGSCR